MVRRPPLLPPSRVSASPGWSRGCAPHGSPTIETGAPSIDGLQHIPFFSGLPDDADDTAGTADCPWCAALREASLPPTARPSTSPGRRHDPYVSGAEYDDW